MQHLKRKQIVVLRRLYRSPAPSQPLGCLLIGRRYMRLYTRSKRRVDVELQWRSGEFDKRLEMLPGQVSHKSDEEVFALLFLETRCAAVRQRDTEHLDFLAVMRDM